MARGKGVRLQRYKDGGVSDAQGFYAEGGADLDRRVPAASSRSTKRNSRTGSATAPKRDDCRRGVFRGIIGLGEGNCVGPLR